MNSQPKFSIGKDLRKAEYDNKSKLQNPSPDSYKTQDQFTKTASESWKFGTSKRKDLTNGNLSVPAPGNYEISSKAIEGPKFCIGLKTLNEMEINDKVNRNRPGPGSYETVDCRKAK